MRRRKAASRRPRGVSGRTFLWLAVRESAILLCHDMPRCVWHLRDSVAFFGLLRNSLLPACQIICHNLTNEVHMEMHKWHVPFTSSAI